MPYRALTTVILVAHFAYLGYVIFGGFLAWRWRWAIVPHVAAGVWGVLIVSGAVTCPLTIAEDWSRRHAGEAGLTRGFIDRYIENVLYPQQYTRVAQALVALVVVGSWLGAYARWRRARQAVHQPSHDTADVGQVPG